MAYRLDYVIVLFGSFKMSESDEPRRLPSKEIALILRRRSESSTIQSLVSSYNLLLRVILIQQSQRRPAKTKAEEPGDPSNSEGSDTVGVNFVIALSSNYLTFCISRSPGIEFRE